LFVFFGNHYIFGVLLHNCGAVSAQRCNVHTAVSRPSIVLAPRDLLVPVLSTRGPWTIT